MTITPLDYSTGTIYCQQHVIAVRPIRAEGTRICVLRVVYPGESHRQAPTRYGDVCVLIEIITGACADRFCRSSLWISGTRHTNTNRHIESICRRCQSEDFVNRG